MSDSNSMLQATIAYFEAQRLDAIATLNLYLHNAVGIGDHSNVVGEIKKLTRQLAEAEECIKTLQTNFVNATKKVK